MTWNDSVHPSSPFNYSVLRFVSFANIIGSLSIYGIMRFCKNQLIHLLEDRSARHNFDRLKLKLRLEPTLFSNPLMG